MKKHFSLILFTVLVLSLFSCTHSSEITKYKVTYVSTYGEVHAPIKVKENSVLYGDLLAELSYEHGTFLGWYIGDTKIEAGNFTVTEDVTLTAKWQINTCFVTFDPGLGIGNNYVEEVDFNTPITIPQNTFNAQVGYKFAGWAKNQGEIVEFNIGDTYTVTEDVSFKAIWIEKDAYSITYHNLKDGDVIAGKKTNPTSYKENQNIRLYSIDRTGYIFEGWFENEDFSGEIVSGWVENTKAKNFDLYAKFTPITYTIRFNPNGGSGEMKDIECTYDVDFSLPDCGYTLTNYKFETWLFNGETLSLTKNLTTENNKVINLYAYWRDAINPASPTFCLVYKREGDALTLSFNTPGDLDYKQTDIYVYKGTTPTDSNFVKKCEVSKSLCDINSTIDYKIDGLEGYTDYTFKLVSVDDSENESNPEYLFGKTRVKQEQPVKNLKQEITETSVTYTWEYPTDSECPEFYKLVINKKDENGDYQEVKSFSDKSTTNYTFSGLKKVSLHDYQFVIQENADNSNYTRPAVVTKVFCTPTPDIITVNAIMNTENSVTLGLKVGEGDFDNIIIEYSNDNFVSTEKVVLPSSVTEYKLTNLTSEYPYQIRAYTKKSFENETLFARSMVDATYVSATTTYEQRTGFAYIGSIFYSDGSYSINKVEGKDAVGIVVYVNEDYKPVYVLNKDEAECPCFSHLTDIWVQEKIINTKDIYVPLTPNNCTTASNWEEVLKSLKNEMLPDNKVTVNAWNRGGVGTKVGEYTWFLPLRSEWKIVFQSHKIYDARLEYIGGAVVDDNKHYWTCEIEGLNAYYVNGNGTPGSFRRAEKTYDDWPSLPGWSRALLKVN